ncbi:hypothetical protein I302_103848 [Kwoniella bestiolae CBS 10118]|uniref:C3H1-type domain-containing protein n=1 Tax=Kwoniella bestiolae CBS 10118 TaxID=1296100 RepID=A0A1B9G9L4_9TREE|nr:hypothetical protein I302_02551 [Kwoniella bestiolae CBS 10118]OCF27706.1 hypothetical protein I302_02551 [Kwoniella bestiolae CBS 10118]
MYTTAQKPIPREVRFASIEVDRPITPAAAGQEEEVKSNIEVDLSSLLSQAQRHNDLEKSSVYSQETDSVYNEGRYRKTWELEAPATAFGGIIRLDDDTIDYKTTARRKASPLSLGVDGIPQPPKTAPLPPSRNTLNFQPFDEPLTPQHGQTTSLQPPTNPAGLYLPPPPTATPANHTLKPSLNPVDNVQNVKSHLEGLSIHLAGLFDQVNQIEELKKEVKYWKDVCLGLEIGKKDMEIVLTQTQNQQMGSKFTAFLIDGDHYIFHEKRFQSGYEGGQEAAQTLLRVVKERNLSEKAIVQIFLNKSTLGATLIKNGIIQTWAKYDQFWQGFSSSNGLITVCDLGSGGDSAQSKIDEYVRLYSENPQCDQIILGSAEKTCPRSTHPSQAYSTDKLLLLTRGDPSYIGHQAIIIPNLFQTTELVPLTARPTTDSVENHIEEYHWSTFQTKAGRAGKSHKINVPPVPVLSSDEFSPKRKFKKNNKYNKAAAEQVRRLDPRPCHTHYLSEWGCRDVDACSYGHGYHLSNAQLNELARMAKSVICPYMKEGRCRYDDEDCVYGHKCPNANKCPFGESCRFQVIPNGHGELD